MSTKKQEAKELFRDANKLYEAQLYEEALSHYKKATDIDLTFYDAHFCVAKTHIRLKDFEEGVNTFQKHIHLIPEEDRATYSVGLAGILLEEGQHEKAWGLVEGYGKKIGSDQLPTFLKILLANGKIDLVLLKLLNLSLNEATEIYQQIANEQSIKETHRERLHREYAIPQYHATIKKAKILSNVSVEHSNYAKKVDEILTYLHGLKKDFGDSLKKSIATANNKIEEAQELLAKRVEYKIDDKNASKAQSLLTALIKTGYDSNKVESFKKSISSIKKKKRNTFLKYASIVLIGVLLIFGGVKLFGYISERSSWKEAQETDNYESYVTYLNEYPTGNYADKAQNLAEVRYWNQIKNDSTPDSFDQYLEKFPDGIYELEALTKFNDLMSEEKKAPRGKVTANTARREPTSKKARVTGSDVIIRSDHTTESEVAGLIEQRGSEVEILDEYYPENANEAILNRSITVYENGESMELIKGKAVSILSSRANDVRVSFAHEDHGRVTTTIDRDNLDGIGGQKWYQVRTADNTTGWIYGQFIEEL
jgi:hypothetical protein